MDADAVVVVVVPGRERYVGPTTSTSTTPPVLSRTIFVIRCASYIAGFGYAIIQTLITDIEPAAKVKAAMNEINAAQRLRLAAYEHSEGEKIRVVKAAEAGAEAKYLAGQGIARQRQAIMAGLKESVQSFQGEVSEVGSKDVLSLMLLTQYFDAIKEIGVGGGATTVFIPSNPGAVADMAAQVRAGILQGDAANLSGGGRR